jgi:acetate kinase
MVKLLIANVGSSSLKCQLLEMPAETVVAKAAVERVGSEKASVQWADRNGQTHKAETPLKDGVAAIRFVLGQLTDAVNGVLGSVAEVDAVGFKTICARGYTGCQYLDEKVMAAMAEWAEYICPLHNEAYIKAVRSFQQVLPDTPMIGLFETAFYQDWPEYARVYAIPWDWTEKYDVRRSMGHGASHCYVNRRIAQILGKTPEDLNVVQLHLGGSSSLTAVRKGTTIDGTAGFTMQTGVPQSVRSSDIDGYLVAYLWSKGEGTPKQIVDRMMTEGGLAGISGMGFDMRDLQEAAEKGHQRAQLAIDTYVYQVRKYLGSMMLILGKVDVITAAGGTGECSPYIRKRIFEDLAEFGVVLDDARNEACMKKELLISSDASKIPVWVVPTNEEIVVARACAKLLAERKR